VASFLLLMSIIAAADWLWVLSDAVRWTLSGIGYAAVAAVVWVTSLRMMIRIPGRRELARRMEAAQPELRENLLSAVELCSDDSNPVLGSPVFRRLLGDRVGRQMAGLNVRSLLPLALVGRWLVAAVLIVAVCAALLQVPGLRFRSLMARAMLPGANIARVSRIQVTILQPTPHSLTLAEDETVGVVVEIFGGSVDEVTLETHAETNGVNRQPMRPHGESRFAANLSIGSEAVDYRILAGDAVTQIYTIRSRPRPRVQAFHKTYRFPEYTGLKDRSLTEPHGDLIVLEGTQADLVLELDQDVSRAEIRLERADSDEPETIPLTPDGNRRLRATLPVVDPGVYEVHLVARETGFENTFSPKYEIRPQPDLIPRVGFVDQEETTLLLPPNDILALAGLAEDDLPLVGLEQQVSVNGRDWEKFPLKIEEAERVTTSWDWDLVDLNLRSGDQVTTKLVATDRKGNVGESIPLHVVVSSPDFDPRRHAVMELKAGLYDKLADLADTIRRHQESAKPLLESPKGEDPKTTIAEADRAVLLDLADKIGDEAGRVFGEIVEVLPRMPSGVDAYELELAARVVARIQHETMRAAEVYLAAASRGEDPKRKAEDLKRVLQSFNQSAEDAQRLQQRYQDFMTHNVLAAVALDLDALLEHQEQLLAPGTPQSWQRLMRQETVAVNQIRLLEQLIRTAMPRLSSSVQSGLLQYLDWARTHREQLEVGLESEEKLETLRKTASSLTGELKGRQNADTLDGRLPSSIASARKELDQQTGSLSVPLERLARTAAEVGRFTQQAVESDDSTQSRQLLLEAQRVASELGGLCLPSTTQLKSRKDATQSRADSDPRYVSDAGLTRRALAALVDRYGNEPPEDSEVPAIFGQIAPAYHTLESGHEVVQLREALANLLSLERWNPHKITARLDHPRQWDAVQLGFEIAARKLKEAKFPAEIASKIDALRWSPPAQDAARKITSRRYRREGLVGTVYELTELQTELDAALVEIKPIMAEARALIAQYAPTIPEMAERAAEELRDLEHETVDSADQISAAKTPESEAADAKTPIDRLQEQQQEINDRIEDLVDALVEDANAQDMLAEEGRQRARDADDSVAMVEEPARQMNRALEEAAAVDPPREQARALAKTAQRQEETAQALDRVAEHFERLDAGLDVAETRKALRQAEEELGIARQMDQQYGRAQELGQLASKTPEELMAELEAELKVNPPMQESLSDISRDALQQAKNSLEYSAEQEEAMRRSIERSDLDFQAEKKPLVQELKDVAEEASALRRTLVAQADYAAASGKDQEARKLLQEAQNDLNEAVVRLGNTSDDNVLDDILRTASEMAGTLESAAKDLAQSTDSTAKTKDENIHDTEEQRAARQRDLETGQRRFQEQRIREAKSRANSRAQSESRAAQQLKSTEKSLQSAQNQVDKAKQALERDPASESARGNLDTAEAKLKESQATVDRAKKELEYAKRRAERANQAAKKLEQAKSEPLAAPNPAAELAHRYAQEATEMAKELTERVQEIAAQSELRQNLRPQANQLTQSAAEQENVGQDVSQAAEDVARAGRHEERLERPMLSDQLTAAAGKIEEVSREEVAGSQRKLTDAAAEAKSAEEGKTQDNQQALAAHASVEEAKEAVLREAEALGQILNPPQAPAGEAPSQTADGQSQQAPTGAPPSGEPSPAEQAKGRLLARTLDELDQAMAAAPSEPDPSGPPQAGPPSLAQAAQAQAARMVQARAKRRIKPQEQPSLAEALESADGAALVDPSLSDFFAVPVNRDEEKDWGQLRGKSAEDLTEGRREAVSAAYRQRVEVYFRVIAERARQKK
jgi:hypothetical protein